ncbi:cytochrome b561 and DOMON domain-containing protein At3g07570-like [Zingiber officinale]|uniref:cytochrome b561 and DOMON domain-containing protein At3g07570-like n=1 Tax=Zingiber officinale TaxID=94328 RepID=UPI001C4DBF17|nr:cytochrome b561 and DOMON domain-containing protein At3g07570-like [Zingiber officinale]
MENKMNSITISFVLLFCFSSSLVRTQSDSCSSRLKVSNLIPFDTTTFHCISAWNAQGFILRYAQTGQNLWSFILSAPDPNSYISIGFSSNGNMDGSSAMAGWTTSTGGSGIAKQYYLGGKSSSQCPPDQGNLQLVPNKTVVVSQSSQLYLAFQIAASQPKSHLIYAVGPQGTVPSSSYYLPTHQSQTSTSINYATGVATSAGSGFSTKRWHGLLTILGWGLLMPVGIIMARYFKHYDPIWFYSHISIQGVGFVLGLAGIIAGFSLDDNGVSNVDTHKAIGYCILVGGILQVMAFLIRPDKSSKIRRYWNWYHHYVGRGAIVLAVANIFLGISIAHESGSWTVAYVICLIILVICNIVLEVKKYLAKDDDL